MLPVRCSACGKFTRVSESYNLLTYPDQKPVCLKCIPAPEA